MARKRTDVLDPIEEAARRDREQQSDVSKSSPDQYGRPFRRMISERAQKARQAGQTVFRTFSDSSARQDLDFPKKAKPKQISPKRLQEAAEPDTERARVYPEVDPNAVQLLPPVDDAVTPIRKPSKIKMLPPVTNERPARQPQRDSRLPSGNTRASMGVPEAPQSSLRPVVFTSPQAWGGSSGAPPRPMAQSPVPDRRMLTDFDLADPTPKLEMLPPPEQIPVGNVALPPQADKPVQVPRPQPVMTLPAGDAFMPPNIPTPQAALNAEPAYNMDEAADLSGTYARMPPPEMMGTYNSLVQRLLDTGDRELQMSQQAMSRHNEPSIMHYLVPSNRYRLGQKAQEHYANAMQAYRQAEEATSAYMTAQNNLDAAQRSMLSARAPNGVQTLAEAGAVMRPGVAQEMSVSALNRARLEEAAARLGLPPDAVVRSGNMAQAQANTTQAAQGAMQQQLALDPMGAAARMGMPPQMGFMAGGQQLGVPFTMPADEKINPIYGGVDSNNAAVFGDQTMQATANYLRQQIGEIPTGNSVQSMATTLARSSFVQDFATAIARAENGDVERTRDRLYDFVGEAIYERLFATELRNNIQVDTNKAVELRRFVNGLMEGVAAEAAARVRQ